MEEIKGKTLTHWNKSPTSDGWRGSLQWGVGVRSVRQRGGDGVERKVEAEVKSERAARPHPLHRGNKTRGGGGRLNARMARTHGAHADGLS